MLVQGAEGENRFGIAAVKPAMIEKAGSNFVETVYYQLIATFCFAMFAAVFAAGFCLGYRWGSARRGPTRGRRPISFLLRCVWERLGSQAEGDGGAACAHGELFGMHDDLRGRFRNRRDSRE
eukprot:6412059-Pyramimonas_sp.AAC.1